MPPWKGVCLCGWGRKRKEYKGGEAFVSVISMRPPGCHAGFGLLWLQVFTLGVQVCGKLWKFVF